MAQENKKRSFREKLRDKYRLIIYNDNTFEEVWFLRLTRLNMLFFISSIFVVIIAGLFALIAFTQVRELIPGYPDGTMRRNLIMNALKLDSLENELYMRDQYFQNLRTIISGQVPPEDYFPEDTFASVEEITFSKSMEDSLLRVQIEEEEQYNLFVREDPVRTTTLSQLHFYPPVRGLVTNSFNGREGHFGTDIVAGPNEVVKSTLPGTVIMAGWTLETGYVIQIQHENNILSVYKHNAELLKIVGNHVEAGDAIAIVGNSGELTTGPHLHFELWYNGRPLDPEKFIVF